MEDKIDDNKPFSTPNQVEDFIKYSPIWKDMERELKIWLSELHMLLENLDGNMSHRELDRFGGSAEAVRNMANFPDVLKVNAESGKRKKKVSKK